MPISAPRPSSFPSWQRLEALAMTAAESTPAVNQQALRCVADARPLALGVDNDPLGHRRVGGPVYVDVAVAAVVLQYRHRGLAADALDQPFAAARDRHVDVLAQPQ